MAGGNHWTPEQRKRLIDGVKSGLSLQEVAKQIGRTGDSVRVYAGRHGIRARKKAGKSGATGRGKSQGTNLNLQRARQKQSEMALARWQSIRDDVIATLNSGAPVDSLVEKYGHSPDYFRKWLKREGWQRPAKPKPEPKQKAKAARAPTNILSRMGRSPAPSADTRGMMIPDAVRELQRFAPCFRADVARDKFWMTTPTHYVFRGAIYPVEELDDVLARVRGERIAA